jgi:uncharacterized DUF497 family protein
VDFDWDEGNEGKNLKHGVHDWEIEEAMTDSARRYGDVQYIDNERRETIFGRSSTSGKYLRIVYTRRRLAGKLMVRPISAVEMTRIERARYRRR